jgi:hypothetical protein
MVHAGIVLLVKILFKNNILKNYYLKVNLLIAMSLMKAKILYFSMKDK